MKSDCAAIGGGTVLASLACQAEAVPEMRANAKALMASGPYRLLVRRVVLPWVLQGEQPAGEGLEIGAGSGAMTAHLLAIFPQLRMVATDYDSEMVERAGQAVAPYGDRARVERADAADLAFVDGRFHLVLSAAMLHHTLAWEKALAEAIRVLRPGGRLIGYDLLDSAVSRLMHFGGAHESGHAHEIGHVPEIGHVHETRLIRPGQLEVELRRLRLTAVRTRRSLGGAVVRFSATKPA